MEWGALVEWADEHTVGSPRAVTNANLSSTSQYQQWVQEKVPVHGDEPVRKDEGLEYRAPRGAWGGSNPSPSATIPLFKSFTRDKLELARGSPGWGK
jgi:hypothetical protein